MLVDDQELTPRLGWTRYADVVVHRLLAAALGLNRLPEDARDREKLAALADNINLCHRNAQMAGRASVELHTLIFFKDRTVIADARITKVHPPCPGTPRCEPRDWPETLNADFCNCGLIDGRCDACHAPYTSFLSLHADSSQCW